MNFLFIGLGSIGQRHLRNLKILMPKSNIFAYRRTFKTPTLNNENKIIKQSLKKKFNIKYIKSLNNLKKFKINAGIICSPSSFHVQESIKLLSQNINIFVEKPLGSNLKYVDKLERLSKKSKKISMVGFQLKFCPIINFLKKIIKERKYGNIKYISIHHGEHIKNFHKYERYEKLYASKKQLGGGVVLTQIHEIDYLLYLLEGYKLKKIKSLSKKITNLKINVEDTLSASMEFESKKRNKVITNLSLNYYEIPRKREINLIFDKGKVKADLVNQNLIMMNETKTIKKSFLYKRNDLFLNELKYFLNCIKKKIKIKKHLNLVNAIDSLKLAIKLKN